MPAEEEGFVEWGAGGTWSEAAGSSGASKGGGARKSAKGKKAKKDKQAKPTDPAAAAREICLRLLSFSPRTRAQLADALRRKDIPDEVSEQVLSRFTEVGLIDDAAFAKAWVQTRHAGRGLARGALAAELRRRGVASETVKDAVDELDPEQEEAAARHLIAKRLPATRGLDSVKRTRRLLGVLARKGYPAGLSYRLVREALENEGTDPPDLTCDE